MFYIFPIIFFCFSRHQPSFLAVSHKLVTINSVALSNLGSLFLSPVSATPTTSDFRIQARPAQSSQLCLPGHRVVAAKHRGAAALSAPAFSHVICIGDSAAAQITARCQTTSGETGITGELRELSLICDWEGAGQQARGCKVILLIIQRAAVGCKEKTTTTKKRGFCPKSPRRCCLLIHSGVSVSQSVLSKIPTLSWVQSHVGAVMGGPAEQQRLSGGTLREVFVGWGRDGEW